jgi:hypothetical protein
MIPVLWVELAQVLAVWAALVGLFQAAVLDLVEAWVSLLAEMDLAALLAEA